MEHFEIDTDTSEIQRFNNLTLCLRSLCKSVCIDRLDIAKLLIFQGADINECLLYACFYDNLPMIKLFIDSGANNLNDCLSEVDNYENNNNRLFYFQNYLPKNYLSENHRSENELPKNYLLQNDSEIIKTLVFHGATYRSEKIIKCIRELNRQNLFKFFKIDLIDDIKSVIYSFLKIT